MKRTIMIGARLVRLVRLAGLIALMTAAVACGADGGEPVTVTLLTHSSFPEKPDLFAPFTERTGIKVRVLCGEDAGTLTNQAVLDREHPQGDAIYGIDNTFLSRALAAEIFEVREYDTNGVGDTFTARLDTHRIVPVDYGDVCFNYDIEWFASRSIDPPNTIDDLVDPAYRGLTVVEDPSTSSPGLAFLLATSVAVDDWEKYWQQLAANDVLVVGDWTQAYQVEFTAGGGGDRPIVLSYASSPPADVVFADPPRDDTNVGVVDDACFRQVEYAGVLANSQHADEAEQVVQYMLSPEFQEQLPLSMFVFPAVDEARLPAVFEQFALVAGDPVSLTADEIDAGREGLIDRWIDIVLS